MSYSFTVSESTTFTVTHARHMVAKVATGLERLQRLYGSPSDDAIVSYETEVIELLRKGYLGTAAYGFRRNGKWIEPAIKYTARDLAGFAANDDDPGRIRPDANIEDASFYSYLTYSVTWDQLSWAECHAFKSQLPFYGGGAVGTGRRWIYESGPYLFVRRTRALSRQRKELRSMNSKPAVDDLFDNRAMFPIPPPRIGSTGWSGLDDHKDRLKKILGLLVNPAGLEAWAKKHHSGAQELLKIVLRRAPLAVLAGDVGCGKTELAETVGDAVARQEKIDITLFPLSLSTRGQGRVGEMTQLLSAAFDYSASEAQKLKGSSGRTRGAVILLVYEADALAQSREAAQMHHEDRAGVNAFIRGVDRLASSGLPAAVIMCTNRLGALDPAVRRRAADILVFERPSAEQRRGVLTACLGKLGFSRSQIGALVTATGVQDGRGYGFTFSDIVQRLLPTIVLDAYPDKGVTAVRAIEIARGMAPTPPFKDDPS